METKPSNLPKELQELQKERGKEYGPFLDDMAGASHIIVTLLAHRLRCVGRPSAAATVELLRDSHEFDDIAPLFMSKAIKAMREATGNYNPDHRRDSALYDWAGEELRRLQAKRNGGRK